MSGPVDNCDHGRRPNAGSVSTSVARHSRMPKSANCSSCSGRETTYDLRTGAVPYILFSEFFMQQGIPACRNPPTVAPFLRVERRIHELQQGTFPDFLFCKIPVQQGFPRCRSPSTVTLLQGVKRRMSSEGYFSRFIISYNIPMQQGISRCRIPPTVASNNA